MQLHICVVMQVQCVLFFDGLILVSTLVVEKLLLLFKHSCIEVCVISIGWHHFGEVWGSTDLQEMGKSYGEKQVNKYTIKVILQTCSLDNRGSP